ncbi:MAG: hypothetical protein AAGF48_09875 [Pseudomonadota bacterium]
MSSGTHLAVLVVGVLATGASLAQSQSTLSKADIKEMCEASIKLFNEEGQAYLVGEKRMAYCVCWDRGFQKVVDKYVEQIDPSKYDLDKSWKSITAFTMDACMKATRDYYKK